MSFGTLFCPKLPTHVHWTYPPVAISIWELLEKQGLFPDFVLTAVQQPGYEKPLFHIASDHSSRLGAAWWDVQTLVLLFGKTFLPGESWWFHVNSFCQKSELRHVAKSQSSKHPMWVVPHVLAHFCCLGSDTDKTAKLHCSHHWF